MSGTARIAHVEPTMFYLRQEEAPRQLVRVTVENRGAAQAMALRLEGLGIAEQLALGVVPGGTHVCASYWPDIRGGGEIALALLVDGAEADRQTVPWEGARDGSISLNHRYSDVVAPPLHPNCRCTLTAVLADDFDGNE